jgi:hypothetical protein
MNPTSTLADGWQSFAIDLAEQPGYQAAAGSYQQAYKNGASAIAARAIHRGLAELEAFARGRILIEIEHRDLRRQPL